MDKLEDGEISLELEMDYSFSFQETQDNGLNKLPTNVMEEIFDHLEEKQFFKNRIVCKKWKKMIENAKKKELKEKYQKFKEKIKHVKMVFGQPQLVKKLLTNNHLKKYMHYQIECLGGPLNCLYPYATSLYLENCSAKRGLLLPFTFLLGKKKKKKICHIFFVLIWVAIK